MTILPEQETSFFSAEKHRSVYDHKSVRKYVQGGNMSHDNDQNFHNSFYDLNDDEFEDFLDEDDIRKPKKRKRGLPIFFRIMLGVLVVLMLTSSALGIYVVGSMYKKPEVDTEGKLPSFVGNENEKDTDSESEDVTGGSQGVVNEDVYTRKKDFYTFLIVGRDSAGLNTDVIMVASFDVAKGKISIMQIPRDTYVEIDGQDYKMNAILAKYYSKAKRENSNEDYFVAGMKGLSTVISTNMNIKLDYYVLVNLKGFRNIIDILGGVYMYIPQDMEYEDPDQDLYISLKEGWKLLNGNQAEQFVRFRKGYPTGDIGRVNAQKLFLSALFKTVKDNISIDKIPDLVSEGIKNVTTNIGVSDMIYFAKNALKVDLEEINMMTLPGEGAYYYGDSGTSYYVLYKEAVHKIVSDYFFVFNEEFKIKNFDIYSVFTNVYNEYINNVYSKPLEETSTEVSNADELYKN
ncbi:MAG: LytR family transcriptional regulator [Ruminococcaceae bacterium]|nr:LytR family transcriptional regulator [Oscillospiraceae bacterium]